MVVVGFMGGGRGVEWSEVLFYPTILTKYTCQFFTNRLCPVMRTNCCPHRGSSINFGKIIYSTPVINKGNVKTLFALLDRFP